MFRQAHLSSAFYKLEKESAFKVDRIGGPWDQNVFNIVTRTKTFLIKTNHDQMVYSIVIHISVMNNPNHWTKCFTCATFIRTSYTQIFGERLRLYMYILLTPNFIFLRKSSKFIKTDLRKQMTSQTFQSFVALELMQVVQPEHKFLYENVYPNYLGHTTFSFSSAAAPTKTIQILPGDDCFLLTIFNFLDCWQAYKNNRYKMLKIYIFEFFLQVYN